jgi:hypothetical protein
LDGSTHPLNHELIGLHAHVGRPQPLRQLSHPRLVRLVVAQENVVVEFCAHGRGSVLAIQPQRGLDVKPRIARHELPWDTVAKRTHNPNGVAWSLAEV